MNDIEKWLQQHGLEEHVNIFKEQQIRVSDLPLLTEKDILELGLPLGPRKRLLAAIDKIRHATSKPDDEGTGPPEWSAAERRQITVVFCDLVGSTELSRELDPEDMQKIYRAYQDTCKNIIDRYEGYIARYMGDGVLVFHHIFHT